MTTHSGCGWFFHNISKLTTMKNWVEKKRNVTGNPISVRGSDTRLCSFLASCSYLNNAPPVMSRGLADFAISPKVPFHTSYNRQRVQGNLIQTSILIFGNMHILDKEKKWTTYFHIIHNYAPITQIHLVSSQSKQFNFYRFYLYSKNTMTTFSIISLSAAD